MSNTIPCLLIFASLILLCYCGDTGHLSNCQTDSDCDQQQYLNCSQHKICQCDLNLAVLEVDRRDSAQNAFFRWEVQQKRTDVGMNFVCVGKLDQGCEINGARKRCVDGASCNDHGECECVGGRIASKTKLYCGASYGETCQILPKNLNCAEQFSCLEGKCACKNPRYERYNSTSKACQKLVGAECENDDSCFGPALCAPYSNGNDKVCQCDEKKGFVLSKDGTECDLAYGQKCTPTFPIEDTGESGAFLILKCDTAAGLKCKERKCQCENDVDVYEEQWHTCSRPLGSPCSSHEECVENSKCVESAKRGSPMRCESIL